MYLSECCDECKSDVYRVLDQTRGSWVSGIMRINGKYEGRLPNELQFVLKFVMHFIGTQQFLANWR